MKGENVSSQAQFNAEIFRSKGLGGVAQALPEVSGADGIRVDH